MRFQPKERIEQRLETELDSDLLLACMNFTTLVRDSDSIYHELFSHPRMVEAVVRQFVPEALAIDLDFSDLQRVNAKFHFRRHSARRREGDVIWRLPTHEGSGIYRYLLFEFQSRRDWWMAVRTQVYQGLLWQQIIAEKELATGTRLPPLLLLVLYNGKRRWDIPLETDELIALSPDSAVWWSYQPHVRYYLLDMGAVHPDELAQRTNLATLLCRLEQRPEPPALERLIDEVVGWFNRHEDLGTLKHPFFELIRSILPDEECVPLPDSLLEMKMFKSNLVNLADTWKKQWRTEGLAEGKAEALICLLVGKFGALTPALRKRIHAAKLPTIERWFKRAITASDVTAVFKPPG